LGDPFYFITLFPKSQKGTFMKTKITTLLALIFLTSVTIYAQDVSHRSVAERVKTTMDKITAPLKLDPSQAGRTDSVFTEFYQALYQWNTNAKSSGAHHSSSAFEKILNTRDEQLKIIFTEGQYSKFKNGVEDLLRPYWQSHEGN